MACFDEGDDMKHRPLQELLDDMNKEAQNDDLEEGHQNADR